MSNPYSPKNFYTQNTVAGQPITTQNNVNQSNTNTYYQPGQFGYPPARPMPKRPYSHGTLCILFFCCLIAVVCAFIPGAGQNIAISLFIGMLTSIVILDWKGFTTLNKRIKWDQMSTQNCWLLACVFFAFAPFLLVFYIVSNTLKSTDEIKQHQPELPSPKKRPALGCATGIVVMLFSLLFAIGATAASTKTATPQQASINTQAQAQSAPTQKPTIVPTPTAKPRPTPQSTPKPQPTQPPAQQPAQAPVQQPTQPPVQQTNAQPASQLFISFTGASAVDYSSGSVSIHTLPGATLTIEVYYCSGRSAVSDSLKGNEYADGSGDYTWTWEPETKCRGTATASVTASLNGQTVSNSDSFNVQ